MPASREAEGAVMERAEQDQLRDRFLGRVTGARPGPTLVCVGGLHGNEPAGVLALERIIPQLEARKDRLSGEFVALVGNRTALAKERRFIDRDLNRAWTDDRLEYVRNGGAPDGNVEDREQLELLATLDAVVGDARGPVYVLDLHTTSGMGGTFSTFGDSLPNRAFAEHIPIPMVLGLEEQIDGTLLSFLGAHGLVAVAVESGQHEEAMAVDRAEAAVWISIRAAGLLETPDVPEAQKGHTLLREETRGVPRVLEMRYRYDMSPELRFAMKPGYENFQPVDEGEAVATDKDGEVCVHEDARLLMPLYQEQGEDGFFLVREIRPFWLRVSYALRKIHADRVARLLPGVRQDVDDPDVLHVNRRIARLFALQLFHLLGYRSVEDSGDHLVVRRRRFDDTRYISRGPTPEPLR